MKLTQLLFLAALVFAGCGDDKIDPNSAASADQVGDAPVDFNGNPLYTLETHYQFQLNGQNIILWGVDQAFGRTNEQAFASLVDQHSACGIRMLVHKAKSGTSNDYTIQIGASDQTGEGCGQLRGMYSLKLTGATTANVVYVSDFEGYF